MRKNRKIKKYIFALLFLITYSLFTQSQSQSRRSADVFTYDNKGQIFQYTGNSKLEDPSAVITSHRMTFYKETELATFSGNVRLFSKTNGSTIDAGYASYDGKTRYAYARNNPILRSPTNNVTIRSGLMERDFNTPIAKAVSNVHLIHIDKENDNKQTDGYADELIYNMDTQVSELKGNARLHQGNDRIEGEVLEYNSQNSQANVMGMGKIYILQTNNYVETTNDTQISNYNIVTADRMFLDEYGGEDKQTRILYAYGNVTAHFYEENMILKGGYVEYEIDNEHMYLYGEPSVRIPDRGIIAFGEWIEYKKDGEAKQFKDVIFHNDVVLVDYDEKLSLEGELLHLDPDTKIATISGDPHAYVEDRSIKIISVTMQMFNDDEKLRANGDVLVESKDMNSRSAWATYFDKRKYLRLWGETPSLQQGGSTVRGREIKYYIDGERIEAYGVSGEIPE